MKYKLLNLLVFIWMVFTGCSSLAAIHLYNDIIPEDPPKDTKKLDSSVPLAVILDLGHGGVDKGTSYSLKNQVICEDELAYDVGQRLLKLVKEKYGRVAEKLPPLNIFPTTKYIKFTYNAEQICDDGKTEFFNFPSGKLEAIRTKKQGGLRQRVNTINAWYEYLLDAGYKKDRIVLISIHFDYGKPNKHGVHILYPGLVYDQQKRFDSSRKYRHSLPRTWHSLKFGTYIMEGLQNAGIPLHQSDDEEKAYLFQGYLIWRNSKGNEYKGRLGIFAHTASMPKVLIEVANLKHPFGRQHALKKEYRQKAAEGIFKGLLKYLNIDLYNDLPHK